MDLLVVQVVEGGRLRKSHGFLQEFVRIGRSAGSDVHLDHPSVSRHHLEIIRQDGAYVLRDCGSANKTYLNGTACRSEYLLDGDEIWVGKYALQIGITSPNAPPNPLIEDIYDYPTVRVSGQGSLE